MKSDQLLIKQVDQFCEEHDLLPPESRIIIGLSGGPDSIFLLHYIAQLQSTKNLTLIAAHLDHQWRSESFKDVAFCAKEAEKLGIRFISATASELGFANKYHGSQEEYGRHMRRTFFEAILLQENAHYIALAHHQDDQIETFFIRLIRGTTISGLRGMRPKQGAYIRPLLNTSKANIVEYLKTHKQLYLCDPSNESPLFLRNRIRNQVIPTLTSIDDRFKHNTLRTMHSLQETDDFLDAVTHQTLEKITFTENGTSFLRIRDLQSLHPYLQKRVLFSWICTHKVPVQPTAGWLSEIIRFLFQEHGGTHRVHPAWSITKKKAVASIRKEQLE